jgi:uncharacterized protein
MFIPAIIAVIFNFFQKEKFTGFKQKLNAKAMLFGIFYPLVFVLLCALLSLIL